jgi:hypothetical protein
MDILKTFGPLIGSVAPTIATALLGPVGGLAVKAISTALFGHENGTQDDIMTALANPTADQLSALKKIDNDFKVQMKSLDIDLEKIAAGDRDSARQMQIGTQSRIPAILSTIVIGGFAAIIAMRVMGFQVSSDPMISDLVTTLRDGVILVLSFYFGSSSGSQQKDHLLYNSVPK